MDAVIMLTIWFGATALLMALFSRRRWASLAPSLRLYLARRLEERAVGRLCLAAHLSITGVFVAVATHRGAELPHDPVSVVMIAVAAGATAMVWDARRTASP